MMLKPMLPVLCLASRPTRSRGSGETARIRTLVLAFSARRCDNYTEITCADPILSFITIYYQY